MRWLSICLFAILGILATSSIIVRRELDLSSRSIGAPIKIESLSQLEKRKGGGGGGGARGGGSEGGGSEGGGSEGGGTSSGGSSSGGSSSGGSSSGGSSGGGAAAGGAAGSASRGTPRTYGGGSYYGGGASSAYRAGGRTPSGLLPVAFLGAGALGFYGGGWLYGAYLYPYSSPYTFYNRTANQNQTKPVQCLCQQYDDCGCDNNNNSTFLNSVIGDGSNLNSSVVRVATVNGTSQIFLNGTLSNDTTSTSGASALGVRMPPVMGVVMVASFIASGLMAL